METKPSPEQEVKNKRIRAYMRGWRHGAIGNPIHHWMRDQDYYDGVADGTASREEAMASIRNRFSYEGRNTPASVTPQDG